jgi:hypothetical protein
MIVQSENDIAQLIKDDEWMMSVLRAAESLELPDWWIGAGFLRNKVWNSIEGIESTPTTDVDLVYFNSKDTTPETDWGFDERMKAMYPFAEWEVRNQARMHYKNNFQPYTSTEDGISHWVETATCVAVKLENENLKFIFCHGTDDLFNLVARPIPYFQGSDKIEISRERVQEKKWATKWPNLQILESS